VLASNYYMHTFYKKMIIIYRIKNNKKELENIGDVNES